MKNKNAITVIFVIMVVAILLGGSIAIKNSSGVNPPFTVIESQSMQHSNMSQIGIIDTGDMIFVKNQNKTEIITYVEGYMTGYSTFGDYGSVIIYKRTNENPVIHRAIIELNYNNDHWEAPSLKNNTIVWYCSSGNSDCMNIAKEDTLTIDLDRKYHNIEPIKIDLKNMNKQSGYVTMGDNNNTIDQSPSSTISPNLLVNKIRIKSVADTEIPWIGSIKLIFNGHSKDVEKLVPNTIPNLTSFIVTLVLTIMSIGFLFDYYTINKIKKK